MRNGKRRRPSRKSKFLFGGEPYFRGIKDCCARKRQRERHDKFMKARGWM